MRLALRYTRKPICVCCRLTPDPLRGTSGEIRKLRELTRAAARGLNNSTLQELKARLVDFELTVTKCEEYKSPTAERMSYGF